MALYNLIGRRLRYNVTDVVQLLAEKLRADVLLNCARMFYCFNFRACIIIFDKVLIELNLSEVYRSVNYIGSLAKFI